MESIHKNFLDASTIYHAGNETASAAREDHQTALSQEKIDKVTRLQAHIRGWEVRKEVFLPQQILSILPFVKQHFVKDNSQTSFDIARLICSELNKISISPQPYKGKRITIGTQHDYTFLKPGERIKTIPRPFRLEIELDDAGKNVELLAVPEGRHSIIDELLGEGGYKEIYRAQDLRFSLELISDQRIVRHTFSVLVYPKKGNEAFQKGYNIHKEILETVQGKFTDLYVPLKPLSDDTTQHLYKQVWYNCTFKDAAKQRFVPITFSPNSEQVGFTLKDMLNVFSDVAKSLQAMHEKGYVHRDIKSNNLFIKLNPGQKPEGYIGDFDLTQKIGVTNSHVFMNEDTLASNGLVFPTIDIIGLVFALSRCLNSLQESMCDQILNEMNRVIVSMKSPYPLKKRVQKIFNDFMPIAVELLKLTSQFEVDDPNKIEPCDSPQELVHILQNFRQLHSASLDVKHLNLLNQLEIGIPVLNELLLLIKYVLIREFSLREFSLVDRTPLNKVKKEVQELKDPLELMNYFNNQIVPMLYDPKEVCTKIQLLAKRLQ